MTIDLVRFFHTDLKHNCADLWTAMYKEAQQLSTEVLKAYPTDDAALANLKAAKNSLSFRSKGMAQAMPEVSLTKFISISPMLLPFLSRGRASLRGAHQTCPVV
jgi:hypothetical protein